MTTPLCSRLEAIDCAMSSSSDGKILSSLSIKNTFVFPKLEKIVANSQPITPAPNITMLEGKSDKDAIPSLDKMIFSSIGISGR